MTVGQEVALAGCALETEAVHNELGAWYPLYAFHLQATAAAQLVPRAQRLSACSLDRWC